LQDQNTYSKKGKDSLAVSNDEILFFKTKEKSMYPTTYAFDMLENETRIHEKSIE